jgi:ABC-2 type transport system permease protein
MIKWGPSPILIKEMRSTMRGARTFIGITLFLFFLASVSLLAYYGATQDFTGSVSQQAGRTIFSFVSVIEMFMLAAVAPTLTAGAIANERQKQTFDMLMATPRTPRQVLTGKLLSSMNYLFLLIFAALPINSIVFLFGGIGPDLLLWWLALTIMLLLMLGTLGLLMSTLFKSGSVATALVYLLCIVFLIIIPIGWGFGFIILGGSAGADGESACFAALSILITHPAASLFSIILNEEAFRPATVLPATLPLYGALAGLFFLGAESRLASLTSQRWNRFIPVLLLLVVIAVAVGYLIVGPVESICTSI